MKREIMCMALFLAAGTAHGQWSDNFNRADGAMGPDWTVTSGTWAIEANQGRHTGTGVNTILTHNSANLQYDLSVTTLDVLRIPGNTANAFVAVVVGLGGANPIMVKIQAQTTTSGFSNIGIYRLAAGAWGVWTGGLPFGALTAQFDSARMTVSFPNPDTIKCELDTNFDGTPDQTYQSTGVSTLSLGTQHGISAWMQNAKFDNWSVAPLGPTGACCLSSGASSCLVTTSTGCTTAGGTYAGDGVACAAANCPPLPTGRCCADDGTCSVLTPFACTSAAGVYGGNGTTCSPNPCVATTYNESGDTGDLPATAQVAAGSGTLTRIRGTLTTGDADMFKIRVCDAANFGATTVGNTTVDTILSIYNSNGNGIAHNDDEPAPSTVFQSRLSNTFVGPAGNGDYYIAVTQFNKQATNALGQLWINDNTTGHEYRIERAPDGPGAASPLTGWTTATGTGGAYSITFTGACFVVGGCYANCDGSTGSPALTANDFQCFINEYAANHAYANCDGSTGNPALTANDFQCFINKYAGGCS